MIAYRADMRATFVLGVLPFLLLLLAASVADAAGPAAVHSPQDPQPRPLGAGPQWRGPVRPTARNEVFATGNGCAMCHSASPAASAMRTPTGDDASPHGLWQASMMANSFRDPYWRAQVAKESAADPDRAGAVQALCLRCHAPMAHHTAQLGGTGPLTMAAAAADPLAQDGVSCTVCHQAQPDGLGEDRSFSGRIVIGRERVLFGPFADPATAPMRMHTGYTPVQGAHLRQSAHCGSCHTLFTGHTGAQFPEQTPYLEWRNSVFTTEGDAGVEARSCQQCHMPSTGRTRAARNPMGRDFAIPAREHSAHSFLGGNAFMLDLLREHRAELGVTASEESLHRAAAATRRQLAEDTATVTIGELARKDGRLVFDVAVQNLTGHKFPTGYPARRAWLSVEVRAGRQVLFRSGAYDDQGRLLAVADELDVPHPTLIERPDQVAIYELVAADADGRPTTHLTRMARRLKDTRLLPRGWRRDGAHAEATAPAGIGADLDFVGGGDRVAFAVPLPDDAAAAGLQVVAWLLYQPVPPAWVAALRDVDDDAARAFVRMYDGADKQPETVAVALRGEG